VDIDEKGEAWVAFLDIYGFSGLLATRPHQQIYQDMIDCFAKVEAIAEQAGVRFISRSDSLFFFAFRGQLASDDMFPALVDCLTESMDELVDAGFLPRGSLAHGDVVARSTVFVGGPILRSVRMETSLAVPCVVVPASEAGEQQRLRFSTQIPIKEDGLLECFPIFPRTLLKYRALVDEMRQKALRDGPPKAAKDLSRCLELIDQYGIQHVRFPRPAP